MRYTEEDGESYFETIEDDEEFEKVAQYVETLDDEDIDEEELKQFIIKFDLNEDGEIDYYEFITCMDNINKDDNNQPYDS